MPLPSFKFDDGQCTRLVCCAASRAISSVSTQTQWASTARGPVIPTLSR